MLKLLSNRWVAKPEKGFGTGFGDHDSGLIFQKGYTLNPRKNPSLGQHGNSDSKEKMTTHKVMNEFSEEVKV